MADKQLARSGAPDYGILSDDDPLSELARIVGYDNRPAVQQLQELEKHRENIRIDPVLALEDELMREFEAYDTPAAIVAPVAAEPVSVSEEAPASAEPVAAFDAPLEQSLSDPQPRPTYDVSALTDGAQYLHNAESAQTDSQPDAAIDAPVTPALDAAAPVYQDAVYEDVDLERELGLSIGYDEQPVGPFIDETLPEVEPSPIAPVPQAEPVAAAQQVTDAPVAAAAKPVDEIDALLADIERFPVSEKPSLRSQPDSPRKNNYPFTPTFSRATPVASNGSPSSQRAFATPLPVVTAAPVAAFVAPVDVAASAVVMPEPVATPVVVQAAPALQPEAEPDFDLDNFELDLSDIDLDLDLSQDPFLEEMQPAIVPAPVLPASLIPAPAMLAPFVPTPMPDMRPVTPEVFFEEPVEEIHESMLPFDPAMISETEESVTAITDLNVPQLPVVEQEKPVAYQPDYDLDLDAEMAQLFATPDRSAPSLGRDEAAFVALGAAAVASQASSAGKSAGATQDYDEFEKAMEEDFRRSLTQRHDVEPGLDAPNSGYVPEADYAGEPEGRSGARRLLLLAATVAGIAIFGGVGVYAFMDGTGSIIPSGDPKIILADKTPVKMVPVEKGGKTVPNQDKAVYDRVAGAQDQAPQQGTLVSSTEEPVDVVQRTLTPESLPLEGRDDGDLSSVDDDGSERLLADADPADTTTASQDAAPAVSPRKVRTMIVKPDGTLVAREEPAATAPTTVASATQPRVTPVQSTTITPPETASLDTLRADEADQPSALEQAANANVEELAPVRPVKTTTQTDTSSEAPDPSPVPQARPVVEKPITTATIQEPATKPAAAAAVATETTPVQTAALPAGTYVVQIASLPSEAEAQKSYRTLSGKYNVIAGKGVDIKKAEIAGKGTYYRVRIPAAGRDEANALCARYKSAGGSCLVTR